MMGVDLEPCNDMLLFALSGKLLYDMYCRDDVFYKLSIPKETGLESHYVCSPKTYTKLMESLKETVEVMLP